MADHENDMSGRAAATAKEGVRTAAARQALHSEAPSAAEIGRAVAEAMQRQASRGPELQRPMGAVVRASCRAGTHPATGLPLQMTFAPADTADGKEYTVKHGRAIHLKREAFERYAAQGKVILAE